MKLESIKQAGSPNLLKWAIDNKADFLSFKSIVDMIGNESFYLVTISDVNFFEVFRLVQVYREKLRIIERKPAYIPSTEEMKKYFPGEVSTPDKSESMELAEMAKLTAETFMNIALQMNADDDIISSNVTQLYSSMISLKYIVQFPISFQDFISAFKNSDELNEVFNEKYPDTLNTIFESKVGQNIKMLLQILFVRNTSIIKYDTKTEQLLEAVKYSPLQKIKFGNKLYRYALSSFYKYDNISRSEVRCTIFKADKATMAKTMEHMKKLPTPIKVSFVIQIPIYYMMMIENSFSKAELSVSYESSMSSIIAENIRISDFITNERIDPNSEDVVERENAISAYKSRIEEANASLLSLVSILIAPEHECDITNTFALLPAAYTAKAIITVDSTYEEKYTHHFDPVVSSLFKELMTIANSIL